MREGIVPALFLWFLASGVAQTVPADWKVLKDAKSACQIAVPKDWSPLSENSGAVVLRNSETAIAVVTSQPGQAFQPMPEGLLRALEIPKERVFENSAKRVFYQDKVSRNTEDTNAYSSSVAGKKGTCSCHVVFLPSVGAETAKKIALSVGAAAE